jgi:hypothetical protein
LIPHSRDSRQRMWPWSSTPWFSGPSITDCWRIDSLELGWPDRCKVRRESHRIAQPGSPVFRAEDNVRNDLGERLKHDVIPRNSAPLGPAGDCDAMDPNRWSGRT